MKISSKQATHGFLGRHAPCHQSQWLTSFFSDMVLIARIRLQQGRYSDALKYASKALTLRRECLGERLKVCDSLYQVANILSEGRNTALAM